MTNLMETPAKIGKFMEVIYIYIISLNIQIIVITCYYYYYCRYIVLYIIYRSIYLWMPFYIFYDILRI